jgi:hypothetical protein
MFVLYYNKNEGECFHGSDKRYRHTGFSNGFERPRERLEQLGESALTNAN